ncbi:uncharacterized protein MONOS_17324 [Monocercomonoides exilis]|uniref:uncharacterized protein n=1 Tax=Monocercomonoides exilis TaxID=2049356 RepID=UPI0035597F5F|nr:hypothetical protein MONOS_17323 [Monocercomonoides exilis]KAH7827508.1 hypothetical protein MONOS_17324 [Monocercomonoides exilis]
MLSLKRFMKWAGIAFFVGFVYCGATAGLQTWEEAKISGRKSAGAVAELAGMNAFSFVAVSFLIMAGMCGVVWRYAPTPYELPAYLKKRMQSGWKFKAE